MANRTYADVQRELARRGIEFSGKSRINYRQRASKFATYARGWSEKRYRQELKKLERAQQYRQQYAEAREILPANLARKAAHKSRERLKTKLRRLDPTVVYIPDTEDERKELWGFWSQYQEHPDLIKGLAYDENKRMRFDHDGKYGFAIAYYHYVYGIDIEDLREWIDVDVTEPSLYVENLTKMGLI